MNIICTGNCYYQNEGVCCLNNLLEADSSLCKDISEDIDCPYFKDRQTHFYNMK